MAAHRKPEYFPARSKLFAVLLLFIATSCVCAQPLQNQLKNQPSPYLALHGDDPVAWQSWSPATLALARKENKLLFVSIGYFSCHWCHVMQAESYRNAQIAALLNAYFIPVKVDKELDMALDAELIAYARRTLGVAGWPLNVFVTPEGYPLFATLYQKPAVLVEILRSISREWQADSAGLKTIAVQAARKPQEINKINPTAALALQQRQQLVAEALAQADFLSGGINVPSKFPLAPQLTALLEIEARQHNARLAEWLRLTLTQMAAGGLRDQLGGGFFRYTVDPLWQRPHFEKMLYDNAQLALIYLRAAAIFKQPEYREIGMETLDFMLREMQADGGFVSSISAVSAAGIEGGDYLWTAEQLKAVLDNADCKLVSRLWGMDKPAEFAAGYLPVDYKAAPWAEQAQLKTIYASLLQVRNQRVMPKDSKVLAGLNGLALLAFSEAAELSQRYRQAADALQHFLLKNYWQHNVLQKGSSQQHLLGEGDLESYAYVAAGLMYYAHKFSDTGTEVAAQKIALSAWQKFYTPQGFLLAQQSGLAQPFYQAVIEDGPLPSPSSVLIEAALQQHDPVLRELARDGLALGAKLQESGVFWFATQVTAIGHLY